MKDLSLHLSDIIENSARAGAGCVWVDLSHTGDEIILRLQDDGPGFPDEVGADPSDPFATTRTERPVGLGLGLLRQSAEQAGGRLTLGRSDKGGVRVEARYSMAHIDAPPLGDLTEAVCSAIVSWSMMEIVVCVQGLEAPVLDTRLIKEELGDVPLTDPRVLKLLDHELREALCELEAWAGRKAGGLI